MGNGYSRLDPSRTVGMSGAAEILLTGRTFDGRRGREL